MEQHYDTVADAAASADQDMPYASLGLTDDEYAEIKRLLGRRPTSAELAMYSVMWSEHCSYKSSKKHLGEQFGAKTTPEMKEKLLVGMGQNAGVVDVGNGWAVTFKVESHNHPSYVEPYQGAATGVGGIVRDIISMGARPVAVMDQLRFGDPAHPDTARTVNGIVAGVGGYGNCLGLANIGGETEFDASYQGNPLVNALCLGVLRHDDIHLANATGVGNQVVLFGARTGGDGIGGASILASESFTEGMPTKRPSVQVGDPFMEKVLIEACLELFEAGVIEGIQDLGAAGISCATSELASNGNSGMHVNLETVLLRDPTLNAGEILMSESQERMMAVVTPANMPRFQEILAKWDVEYSVIGEVTGDGRLTIDHHGHRIVDVDPKTVAHDGPVYDRPYARPKWQDGLNANTVASANLPRVGDTAALRDLVMRVCVTSANQAAKNWVTNQYDRYVQGNTALAQPDDAGVVRVDPETNKGVAISTDANGWFTKLDPYQGARQSLAEAYRNVVTAGARPLAITNCLNFGSPEDTDAMWQLVQGMTGLADGCQELAIPVTGGNVSLYNSSGGVKGEIDSSINPTVVVGMLGVMDDVRRARCSGLDRDGLAIVLLGSTRDELDASAWAREAHGHFGGLPPQVDLQAEEALGNVLLALVEADSVMANGVGHATDRGKSLMGKCGGRNPDGSCACGYHKPGDPLPGGENLETALPLPITVAAHDVSNAGLINTLLDMCLRFGIGASIDLTSARMNSGLDPETLLFSESQARAVIAVREGDLPAVMAAARAEGVEAVRLGTSGGDMLVIEGLGQGENVPGGLEGGPMVFDLAEVKAASEAVIPGIV